MDFIMKGSSDRRGADAPPAEFQSFQTFKSLKPPPSSSPASRGRKEVEVERSAAVERIERLERV